MTHSPIALILRAEALATLIAALFAYHLTGASWWLFAALILVPDLSMIGYLHGPRTGAICYNIVHSYAPVLTLGAALWALGIPFALPLTAILVAHIAADRAMGFGLKRSTGFHDTHLQSFA
ncbi:DUF4260 domain-containing protein [Pseudosulfitobacter koreensis]|uniref:DUF4260 domain-containing protein n=1 Tax=Pseudosulfitobacter koreensis TaxID=2968472 RepID=A0ABT1Z4F2_9RHOB|nr:DUF4260 domain-containing protein [Pseudosulfitobacter koreense]MCR8828009.1 DUF4260 domain-containing protein [Pseudosulfitobacter koreense]